jgi:hypothetical protein
MRARSFFLAYNVAETFSMTTLKFFLVFSTFLLLPACNEEFKARIDTLNSEKAALQAELTQVRAANAALVQQIDEIRFANLRFSEAKAQAEAGKPRGVGTDALPVSVRFRDAMMGHGRVLMLNTTMKAPLTVLMVWENAATGARREKMVNLDGSTTTEFGHAEGFPLERGDTLTLSNKSFDVLRIPVD